MVQRLVTVTELCTFRCLSSSLRFHPAAKAVCAQYPTSIDPGCMPSHLVASHFMVVPLRSFDDVGFGGAEII